MQDETNGVGIGLSTSNSIIQALGGKLKIQTNQTLRQVNVGFKIKTVREDNENNF